jgi:hypothetical protein
MSMVGIVYSFHRQNVDAVAGSIARRLIEPLDLVPGEAWLSFGGVAPSSFPIISAKQQLAEKLHAYTLPGGERVNTRTKDLIDWEPVFDAVAKQCDLPMKLREGFEVVREFKKTLDI